MVFCIKRWFSAPLSVREGRWKSKVSEYPVVEQQESVDRWVSMGIRTELYYLILRTKSSLLVLVLLLWFRVSPEDTDRLQAAKFRVHFFTCYRGKCPQYKEIKRTQFVTVILPPSALDHLTRLNISYPMLFKLTNRKADRTTHAGVLEFVAEEAKVFLPYWVIVFEFFHVCYKSWGLSDPRWTVAWRPIYLVYGMNSRVGWDRVEGLT